MKKQKIQVFIRTGYGGKVTASATVNEIEYVVEKDWLEQYLEKAIKNNGYKISKTNRQKYPRLTINSLSESKKDDLIEALNHMDGLADIGADDGEKSDLQKSYNFLFNFISSLN